MSFKPTCPKCSERVSARHEHCPTCGARIFMTRAAVTTRGLPDVPKGVGRYAVTEVEGFLSADAWVSGLTCHVLDTAYCHRVVFTARTESDHTDAIAWHKRERVRGLARARAMELNAAA